MQEKKVMTEQFEQVKREFEQRYGKALIGVHRFLKEAFSEDLTALLEQHKEMMLRDELIAFGKVIRSWGIVIPSDILECSADEYLKNMKK